MCRDVTKSHPYTSRHLGNRIEVVQPNNPNKTGHEAPISLIMLFTGYFWLINTCEQLAMFLKVFNVIYYTF